MSKISELSDGGALQSTDYLIAVRSGGNVKVQPAGMTFSSVTITSSDINGGNIDGTVIGAATPAAGSFTTITGSDDLNIDSGTFFVDASANAVGIGTTSPGFSLEVAGNQRITKGGAGYEAGMLSFSTLSETGAIYRMGMAAGGAFAIGRSDTATTNITLDSSGNVGIGVTPSAWGTAKALQAGTYGALSSAGAGIDTQLSNNCYYDGTNWKYIASQEAFRFQMNRNTCAWFNASAGSAGANISFTQAMTLDSSGNLLVGTTSTGVAALTSGGGSVISSAGATAIAYESVNSTDPVLLVNNTGTDGSILEFRKDGSTVGSIGTVGGNDLSIGTDTTGLRFYDGSNADGGVGIIVPWNVTANAARDAQMNLGSGTERYRNLYLSGGVYLGGTGAANKLDDYETGTWTPTIEGLSGGSLTLTTGFGYEATYVKVGNLVTVYWRQIRWTAKTTLVGNVYIGGLPFALASDIRSATGGFGGSATSADTPFTDRVMQVGGDAGTSYAWIILKALSNNEYVHAGNSNFASAGTVYGMSFTYKTA